MSYRIELQGSGSPVFANCPESESILSAFERRTLYGCSPITVGCKSGGCGLCKIKVVSGRYDVGFMSKRHITEDRQKRFGEVLACQTFPLSDMIIELIQ